MPLWKAMSKTGRQTDIHYRYFIEIGPALAWLDVLETRELQNFFDRASTPD
jgi:hypothetical protein